MSDQYGSPEVETRMQRTPICEGVPYGVGTFDYTSVVLPLEVRLFQSGSSEFVIGALREFMQVDIINGSLTSKLYLSQDETSGLVQRELTEEELRAFAERMRENPDEDRLVAAALVHFADI